MTRPSHPGRPGPRPFAAGALAAAADSVALSFTETCRIGTPTSGEPSPDPPYTSVPGFDPVASDVPCSIEPGTDRQAMVAGDPSTVSRFELKTPHGTPLAAELTVEITGGRNTGLKVRIVEVHDSTTEPALRATCERIDPGTEG